MRDRKDRLESARRRARRETNTPPKGCHKSPHKSRRERNDPRTHAHPFGTLRPTGSGSSRSLASSHTAVESDEDLCDDRVDAYHVRHTGPDHIDTLGYSDDDYHGRCGDVKYDPSSLGASYERDVSEALSGLDIKQKKDIDIATPFNSGGGRNSHVNKPLSRLELDDNKDLNVGTPSDLDGELTAGLRNAPRHSQELPPTAINVGTLHDGDDDYDGLPADGSSSPSDSDGSHGSHLSKALCGLETDRDEDLDVATLSDPDEEKTPSLRNPRPRSPGLLTTALRDTSTIPNTDSAKDRCDASHSLHAILDPDHKDTTADSDSDYPEDQHGTPSSSDETSDQDQGESSDAESWSSDSAGDQEEGGCQVSPSLSQVAKTDLGDAIPSDENWDARRSASPLDLGEGHQVEDTPNAVIRPQQSADADIDDTSSTSEDKDLATGDSHGSTDISSENEEDVDDDGLGHDEGYSSALKASPEKLRTASIIAPAVVPSSQEDTAGSGDSKAGCSASHNASETESPDTQSQPSSSAKLPSYIFPGVILQAEPSMDQLEHPYLITQTEPFIMARLGTSRPKFKKFKEQYGKPNQGERKIHFSYVGGKRMKPFVTKNIPRPRQPDLIIKGPPMPFQTYFELEERGPFEPSDFKLLRGQLRQLDPESLKELNLSKHGCKKSPPESVPAAQPEILT